MRPSCTLCFWFLVLVPFSVSSAIALDTSLFEYTGTVTGDPKPGEPARIALSHDALSRLKGENFSDLKLMDDQKTEIPYVIYNRIEPGEVPQAFEFTITAYDQKDKKSFIRVKKPERAPPFREIEFVTGSPDFKKNILVEGSHDGKSWDKITSDVIFDFSSSITLSKVVIELPRPVEEPFLRITLEDEESIGRPEKELQLTYDGLEFKTEGINTKPFRISAIRGRTGSEKEEKPVLDSLKRVPPGLVMTRDKDGNTVIPLGPLNLPVTEILFDVANPYFFRRAEIWASDTPNDKEYRPVASGSIYRVTGMKRPEMSVTFPEATLRHAKVIVINQNNPPLDLKSLELKWIRKDLYFIPEEGRTYLLCLGSDEGSPSSYELGKILPENHRELASYRTLSLGNVIKNPAFLPGKGPREVRERREKIFFTVAIVFLVLLIGLWLTRLLKQVSRNTHEKKEI